MHASIDARNFLSSRLRAIIVHGDGLPWPML
jgi:hypothetical protein